MLRVCNETAERRTRRWSDTVHRVPQDMVRRPCTRLGGTSRQEVPQMLREERLVVRRRPLGPGRRPKTSTKRPARLAKSTMISQRQDRLARPSAGTQLIRIIKTIWKGRNGPGEYHGIDTALFEEGMQTRQLTKPSPQGEAMRGIRSLRRHLQPNQLEWLSQRLTPPCGI